MLLKEESSGNEIVRQFKYHDDVPSLDIFNDSECDGSEIPSPIPFYSLDPKDLGCSFHLTVLLSREPLNITGYKLHDYIMYLQDKRIVQYYSTTFQELMPFTYHSYHSLVPPVETFDDLKCNNTPFSPAIDTCIIPLSSSSDESSTAPSSAASHAKAVVWLVAVSFIVALLQIMI